MSPAILAVVAMYGAFMAVGWAASRKVKEGSAADLIVAGRAMPLRCSDIEPLQLRLFVDDDQVDVVTASETVVGHRQETVRVGGQVNAGDSSLLGEHRVDEPGTLVAEAVVIVAPARGREEDVE